MSELTRMRSGETYNCLDEELKLMRAKTAQLVFQFNHEPNPGIRRQLLAEMGVQLENSACIEPPLQLTYGCHLSIGETPTSTGMPLFWTMDKLRLARTS